MNTPLEVPSREPDLTRTHPAFGGMREDCWWPEMLVQVTRLAKGESRTGRLAVIDGVVYKVSPNPSEINTPQALDRGGQEKYACWLAKCVVQ